MTIILQTERTLLRTWSLADAEDNFKIWGDPLVTRYIRTGEPHRDVEQTRAWINRMIAHQEQHGFCFWAMLEKQSGLLIGCCGMSYQRDGGLPVEFGYNLARSHWGRGLVTESAGACLRYAFENFDLPELSASVDARNVASQRVLEKIGFVYQRTEQLDTGIDLWYVARRRES
jgi:[ribosomal protein S5]-alanine N-acetyltransferase